MAQISLAFQLLLALCLASIFLSQNANGWIVLFMTNRTAWSIDGTRRQNSDSDESESSDKDLGWFEKLDAVDRIAFIVGIASLGLVLVLCGCGALCGYLCTEVCNKKPRASQPQLVVLTTASGTTTTQQIGPPTGQSDILMVESGLSREPVTTPLLNPPPIYTHGQTDRQ